MGIQYCYACLTMLPCPMWFWYRWPSGIFLAFVFMWSIYNGATFYIDHYGKKFEKELDALKKDVAKWQASPEGGFGPPTPSERRSLELEKIPPLEGSTSAKTNQPGELRERI